MSESEDEAMTEATEDAFIAMIHRTSLALIVCVVTAFSLAIWRACA